MIKFCPLFSGSSGNALYLKYKDTSILIDAGLSKKRITQAISDIGEDASKLNAIIITHEHIDHTSGIGVMERGYNIPIYANISTWNRIPSFVGRIKQENIQYFETGKKFSINDVEILPFSIPHDAADPVGFSFYLDSKKVTSVTDIGHLTETILDNIKGSDLLLMESNHDLDMLINGPYPWPLKKRIKGDFGHLCNKDCGDFIAKYIEFELKTVVLGHLSAENNIPQLAYDTVKQCIEACGYVIGRDVSLEIAKREGCNSVYEL